MTSKYEPGLLNSDFDRNYLTKKSFSRIYNHDNPMDYNDLQLFILLNCMRKFLLKKSELQNDPMQL